MPYDYEIQYQQDFRANWNGAQISNDVHLNTIQIMNEWSPELKPY